jgi:hypothetical protein
VGKVVIAATSAPPANDVPTSAPRAELLTREPILDQVPEPSRAGREVVRVVRASTGQAILKLQDQDWEHPEAYDELAGKGFLRDGWAELAKDPEGNLRLARIAR